MPATPDDIAETAAQIAADGVASTESDGVKVATIDPLKLADLADRQRPVTNGWGRMARGLFTPGGTAGPGGCE